MFRLTIKTSPERLELLSGLVVTVRPLSTALSEAAKSEAITRALADYRRALDHKAAGGEFGAPSEDATDASVLQGLENHYECEALARFGIMSWEGVGDEDGAPAEPTAENIRKLMAFPRIAPIFRDKYIGAFLLTRDAEGNASGLSSDGASADKPNAGSAPDAPPHATPSSTPTALDASPAPAS